MFNLKAKNPPVCLEIGEGYASAVKIQNRGSNCSLVDYHQIRLPFRAEQEKRDWNDFRMDENFQEGIKDMMDWLGKTKKLSLVLPDSATRSFMLEIENEGANQKELRDIIMFKIQKFAPISSEGTSLAYKKLTARKGDHANYLALISSKTVTGTWERFFAQAGTHIGRIETASLAVVDRFASVLSGEEDCAMVRVGSRYFTVTIFHNNKLSFARSRFFNSSAAASSAVLRELNTLNLFVKDKLGHDGFEKVFIYGPGEGIDDTENLLTQSNYGVETLSLTKVMDVPNQLLHRPMDEGRIIAAASVASRR